MLENIIVLDFIKIKLFKIKLRDTFIWPNNIYYWRQTTTVWLPSWGQCVLSRYIGWWKRSGYCAAGPSLTFLLDSINNASRSCGLVFVVARHPFMRSQCLTTKYNLTTFREQQSIHVTCWWRSFSSVNSSEV